MHDLFVKVQDPDHCLHVRSTTNSLRERGHNFELYEYNYTFFRQSFVANCLFKFFIVVYMLVLVVVFFPIMFVFIFVFSVAL